LLSTAMVCIGLFFAWTFSQELEKLHHHCIIIVKSDKNKPRWLARTHSAVCIEFACVMLC
jgi:hypothetical protein